MKKALLIIYVFCQTFLFSSCSFMEGMMGGMASMAGIMGGGYGTSSPSVGYGSSVPASWGNGYAGPMTYSSDPVINATIGIAQTEARLVSQGVNISTQNNSSSSNKSRSSSSSTGSGWYQCCSSVANFGLVSYHKCSNCGVNHQVGSGHMCKKK